MALARELSFAGGEREGSWCLCGVVQIPVCISVEIPEEEVQGEAEGEHPADRCP